MIDPKRLEPYVEGTERPTKTVWLTEADHAELNKVRLELDLNFATLMRAIVRYLKETP